MQTKTELATGRIDEAAIVDGEEGSESVIIQPLKFVESRNLDILIRRLGLFLARTTVQQPITKQFDTCMSAGKYGCRSFTTPPYWAEKERISEKGRQ